MYIQKHEKMFEKLVLLVYMERENDGFLVQGKKVAEFEQEFASFIGVKHAIASGSTIMSDIPAFTVIKKEMKHK